MAGYDIYHHLFAISADSNSQYPHKNKGVLIVPGSVAAGSAVLITYAVGGTTGTSITVNTTQNGIPFVIPVQLKGTGAISNCSVYELL